MSERGNRGRYGLSLGGDGERGVIVATIEVVILICTHVFVRLIIALLARRFAQAFLPCPCRFMPLPAACPPAFRSIFERFLYFYYVYSRKYNAFAKDKYYKFLLKNL